MEDVHGRWNGPHGHAHRSLVVGVVGVVGVVAAALSLSLLACSSEKTAVKGDAKPDTTAKAKKGLNDRFTDPNLDVAAWIKRFEREQREVFKNRVAIVKTMGLEPGNAVADIGAGTGAFTAELAKTVGETGKVHALDISPKFIAHLKARVATEGLKQVAVKLSEPNDITLPEGSIDVAFACDTYHHFENPQAILKTIHRALKPGGRLVIVDFHRIEGKTKEWLMKHVRAGQEVFAKEITDAGFERMPDPPHEYLVENYLMVFKRP